MPKEKHLKNVSFQLEPVHYAFIEELGEEYGMTKRAVIRAAFRAGMRKILEKYGDPKLIALFEQAVRRGFKQENEKMRKSWGVGLEGIENVYA